MILNTKNKRSIAYNGCKHEQPQTHEAFQLEPTCQRLIMFVVSVSCFISKLSKLNYMSRKITEILKDADATMNLQGLINLWNEIANNKKQYPLKDIWNANKHIRELALKSNGQDIDKGKFYHELKSQCDGVS